MKPIVLIGSRQDNRQLIAAAESTGRKIVGILDRFYVGQVHDDIPIIGSDLDLLNNDSDIFKSRFNYDWFVSTIFTGVTNYKKDEENSFFLRNQRAQIASQANLNLINIQHSNSYVDPTCQLGNNIYFGWGTYIGAHCKIGNFNHFAYNCGIGHHNTIGNFCNIVSTVTAGNVKLGNNVFIGPGINITRRGKSPTMIGDNCILVGGGPIIKSIGNDTIYFNEDKTCRNTHYKI